MNNYTLESFISFCDDMMIAEEGFSISGIKAFLKKLILKVLHKAEVYVKKIKNQRIKNFLLKAIANLKTLLGETEKINNENCHEKFDKISHEVEKIEEEIEEQVGKDDEEKYDAMEEIRSDGEEDTKNKPYTIMKRSSTGRGTYFYDIKLNDQSLESKIYSELLAADKAETFSEYIPHFKNFKKLVGLPDKCIVYGLCLQNDSLSLYFILENNRLVKRNIDKPLYHTSKDSNLKQLTPHWRAERERENHEFFTVMSGRYFDTPRIYFGTVPINRFGSRVSSADSDISVYKVEGIRQAYIDVDGMTYGKAVYIESNSPVPVTKVDYFNGER